MNNNEKKEYINTAYKLYMLTRPYENMQDVNLMLAKENALWNVLKNNLLIKQPKSFYKYRKATDYNFTFLEKGLAWFSLPKEFGDTRDLTINNDIEEELEGIEKDPNSHIIRLSTAFIKLFMKEFGVQPNDLKIEDKISLFNSNGSINCSKTKMYLMKYGLSVEKINLILGKLITATQISDQKKILEAIKLYLTFYMDINKKNHNELFVYSLTEDPNNAAMWESFADNATGYCIEYQFDKDSFLGQRMLMNLFPIYYGDKERINFFDILIKNITYNERVGMNDEDSEKIFLQSYTKESCFDYQKEWRIVFAGDLGGSTQKFPFAKSIIIGERASEDNKKRILDIGKKLNIDVYLRKMNKTGSKVMLEKVWDSIKC